MRSTSATEVIAKYDVMGPRAELEKTLPLEDGEDLLAGVRAATRYDGDGFLGRLNTSTGGRRSFVRVTNRRVCVARHYGLIRDRILVIPESAILRVTERGSTEMVEISFRVDLTERVLTIVTWRPVDSNRGALSPEIPDSLRRLALVLGAPGD